MLLKKWPSLSISKLTSILYMLGIIAASIILAYLFTAYLGLAGVSLVFIIMFCILWRLKVYRERFKNLCSVDPLTGLYSLSYLIKLGNELLQEGSSITILLIDLDGFNQFNDTYGHLIGNKVLTQVGDFLVNEVKTYKGIVGRLGGDEFIILLENCSDRTADKIKYKIQYKMANEPLFTADEQLCSITIPSSIGLSSSLENKRQSVEELLRHADTEMYYNKFHKNTIDLCHLESDSLLHKDAQILLRSISEKDMYTYVHSQSVAYYSAMVAKNLNLNEDFTKDIFIAGWIHDLGKIFIPNEILRKKGKLSNEEYEIIKGHVNYGLKIAAELGLSDTVKNAILYHHERFDGSGYPGNVEGSEIPLEGKILQVADSFSAMTVKRVYCELVPLDKALGELKKCSGSQFDPDIVTAFVQAIDESDEIKMFMHRYDYDE